jgi:putative transposase
VYSDRGSQFSSYGWQGFLREHNLVASMSRRGNSHGNAVVESFFSCSNENVSVAVSMQNRAEVKQDIFDYTEMSYNPVGSHSHNDGLSPVKYEMQFNQKLASV